MTYRSPHIIQLFIDKELTEQIELRLTGKLVEQRINEVDKIKDWWKYKYRLSMYLGNWEIRLILQSKMNSELLLEKGKYVFYNTLVNPKPVFIASR